MAWDTKIVRIDENGTVDTDPCQLCKSANPKQRILWLSESDQGYDVQFDPGTGSPFSQSVFPVPAGGSAESGEIQGQPGTYTYNIVNAKTGQIAADPGVIVNA